MKKGIKIALWVIAGLIVVGALTAYFGYRYIYISYNNTSEPVRLYIPRGATEEDIADSLKSALGERFGGRVAMIRKNMKNVNTSTAHGSYLISPGDHSTNVAQRLRLGLQTPVNLTINNIRTLDQLAQRVSEQMEISSDEFLASCDNMLRPMGFTQKEQYPAAFLPDTYQMYWTSSADSVVSRLAGYRNKYWNEDRRAKAKALGLRPVQVATIASIVEKESLKKDEQPTIARLYMNRLNKNIPLQADPTVVFANNDFTIRRVTAKHLQKDSPYNTYKHTGLPPGPICIPAKSSIEAVLNAPKNDYIYMCAKEDFSGYHNFTSSYATHQENARKYRKALDARGIKAGK